MPQRYPSGASREWWRPAHVHIKVSHPNGDTLTTQIYFDDPADPENEWKHRVIQSVDRLLDNVEQARRDELICRLGPPDDDAIGALAAAGLPAPDLRGGRAPRTGRFDAVV